MKFSVEPLFVLIHFFSSGLQEYVGKCQKVRVMGRRP